MIGSCTTLSFPGCEKLSRVIPNHEKDPSAVKEKSKHILGRSLASQFGTNSALEKVGKNIFLELER
jgi:hypothetical protein